MSSSLLAAVAYGVELQDGENQLYGEGFDADDWLHGLDYDTSRHPAITLDIEFTGVSDYLGDVLIVEASKQSTGSSCVAPIEMRAAEDAWREQIDWALGQLPPVEACTTEDGEHVYRAEESTFCWECCQSRPPVRTPGWIVYGSYA